MPSPFWRALAATISIAGLVGCGGPAESTVALPLSAVQAYESYDETWALSYPIDWRMLPYEARPAGSNFGAAGPEAEDLAVATRDWTAPPEPATLLAEARRVYGDRLREAEPALVQGRPGVRLVVDESETAMRALTYWVPRNGTLYELSLRARAEAFEAKRARLEAIASSFKLR
ncbi:MAG: hypothetical protein ACK46X_03565 [Candidatus Sericytochromatia bacterium]